MRSIVPALTLLLSACSLDFANSHFDRWCDGSPCDWTVEAGEVRPVATWHEADRAAELIGPDVRMSQDRYRDEEVMEEGSEYLVAESCLVIRANADGGVGPQLHVELDLGDDGSVEHSAPVTSDDYQPEELTVRLPAYDLGLDDSWYRIRVVKTGSGRAVLAELSTWERPVTQCPDAAPLGATTW